MSEIAVGDRIKDNDPRVGYGRELTVVEVLPYGVAAKDRSGRVFTILLRRIYTDGKPRRNGFDLLPLETQRSNATETAKSLKEY